MSDDGVKSEESEESTAETSSSLENDHQNPLAFLGLRKKSTASANDETRVKSDGGNNSDSATSVISANLRRLSPRKRKRNSKFKDGIDMKSLFKRRNVSKSSNINSASTSADREIVVEKDEVLTADISTSSSSAPIRESKRTAKRSLWQNSETANSSTDLMDGDHTSPPSNSYINKKLLKECSVALSKLNSETPQDNIAIDNDKQSLYKQIRKSFGGASTSKSISISASFDKRKSMCVRLSSVLRNMLKLPKAHQFVCYEFFYSNIDSVLFEGENDFMTCLRETFPAIMGGLQDRYRVGKLYKRVEWRKMRRLIGRPRRCSAAFFAEERCDLEAKRNKIRILQQCKPNDLLDSCPISEIYERFRDLPSQLPIQLPIGSRVTARVRHPQDGLFVGTVEGFDVSNNTYRITFDRTKLATNSVSDVHVRSLVSGGGGGASSIPPFETIPLSTFTRGHPTVVGVGSHSVFDSFISYAYDRDFHDLPTPSSSLSQSNIFPSTEDLESLFSGSHNNTPFLSSMESGNNFHPPIPTSPAHSNAFDSRTKLNHDSLDPLLYTSNSANTKILDLDKNILCYPVRLLEQIVRLRSALKLKRVYIDSLQSLNGEAEDRKSLGRGINRHFAKQYATLILQLSNVNKCIRDHLESISVHAKQVCKSLSRGEVEEFGSVDRLEMIKEESSELAYQIVSRNNVLVTTPPQHTKNSVTGGKRIGTAVLTLSDHDEDDSSDGASSTKSFASTDFPSISPLDSQSITPPPPSSNCVMVQEADVLSLITSLTAVVVQVKDLVHGERSAYQFEALQRTIDEIKKGLRESNLQHLSPRLELFEQMVELKIHSITRTLWKKDATLAMSSSKKKSSV